jgi:hypothetical protein
VGSRFDEVVETSARYLSERFSRKGFLGRLASLTLLVGTGEGAVLALRAGPALAGFSPLCSTACNPSCPSGTIPSGCWVGCDPATNGICGCGGYARVICDCCKSCAGGCGACGLNPCYYLLQNDCTKCRKVVRCEFTTPC